MTASSAFLKIFGKLQEKGRDIENFILDTAVLGYGICSTCKARGVIPVGPKIQNQRLFQIALALLLAVFITAGCGGKSSGKLTAEILGQSKLLALQPIAGEVSLRQLVLVEAGSSNIDITEIDKAYAFEVSPDEKLVAYAGDDGIYVSGIDGSKTVRITSLTPKFDLNTHQERLVGKVMAWAPDGRRLAFVCGGDLFVVDIQKNAEPKLVTKRSPDQLTVSEGAPALAPRIEGIVCPNWLNNRTLIYHDFYNKYDGNWQYFFRIMQVNSDGTGKQVIIEGGQEPILSPDRTKIVYHENNTLGGVVKTAGIDGSDVRTITGLMDADQEPMTYSWSKDGQDIVFDGFSVNERDGKQTAFAGEISLDNQGSKRGKSTESASFSPDGKWVIFSASRGPKFVKIVDDNYTYDSSMAFEPLQDLGSFAWIKG